MERIRLDREDSSSINRDLATANNCPERSLWNKRDPAKIEKNVTIQRYKKQGYSDKPKLPAISLRGDNTNTNHTERTVFGR